jgi:hypothetical protein
MKHKIFSIHYKGISVSSGILLILLAIGCSTSIKREDQSATWRVTITDINRLANERRTVAESGMLAITLDLTYLGRADSVVAPKVVLSNQQNRSLALLDITRTIHHPAEENRSPNLNESFEVLNWFQQKSGEKLRRLEGGEKFTLTYIFEDRGDAGETRLSVGDVPPINLF